MNSVPEDTGPRPYVPPAYRHPGVRDIARWFDWRHLRAEKPRLVSRHFHLLARRMIEDLPDSPELTAGLRKLLEAKDCFVRAAVDADSHNGGES